MTAAPLAPDDLDSADQDGDDGDRDMQLFHVSLPSLKRVADILAWGPARESCRTWNGALHA
ncbi:MAG: hypothetical protein DHS20C03_03660 [Minwuia thermotolerans]|nr:MAG: hypothetical protein DHS20C03_03660 [Minwuia thermotolerans]